MLSTTRGPNDFLGISSMLDPAQHKKASSAVPSAGPAAWVPLHGMPSWMPLPAPWLVYGLTRSPLPLRHPLVPAAVHAVEGVLRGSHRGARRGAVAAGGGAGAAALPAGAGEGERRTVGAAGLAHAMPRCRAHGSRRRGSSPSSHAGAAAARWWSPAPVPCAPPHRTTTATRPPSPLQVYLRLTLSKGRAEILQLESLENIASCLRPSASRSRKRAPLHSPSSRLDLFRAISFARKLAATMADQVTNIDPAGHVADAAGHVAGAATGAAGHLTDAASRVPRFFHPDSFQSASTASTGGADSQRSPDSWRSSLGPMPPLWRKSGLARQSGRKPAS